MRPLLLGAAEARQGRVNWMELVILNKSKVVKPEVTPEVDDAKNTLVETIWEAYPNLADCVIPPLP